MPLNGKRILITGGAGFFGSNIADRLRLQHEAQVIASLRSGVRSYSPTGIEFHEGDARDEADIYALVRKVDTVFHQAALISVDESIERPQESHSINVTGTLNVLEAARVHDTKVVLASSAAIYGYPETTSITEIYSKEPTSPYGLDKLTCDHYARLYHERYGFDTVALRYFNVYGPRQTGGDYAGVISIFIEQALNDDPITVHGDGEQTRDFVSVDDVVQANVVATQTDHVGTGYNIETGESISIRELAELIVDITNSNSDIVHTDGRPGDIEHSCADISKAKFKLDYEPSVSIEEELKRTVEWFQNRN